MGNSAAAIVDSMIRRAIWQAVCRTSLLLAGLGVALVAGLGFARWNAPPLPTAGDILSRHEDRIDPDHLIGDVFREGNQCLRCHSHGRDSDGTIAGLALRGTFEIPEQASRGSFTVFKSESGAVLELLSDGGVTRTTADDGARAWTYSEPAGFHELPEIERERFLSSVHFGWHFPAEPPRPSQELMVTRDSPRGWLKIDGNPGTQWVFDERSGFQLSVVIENPSRAVTEFEDYRKVGAFVVPKAVRHRQPGLTKRFWVESVEPWQGSPKIFEPPVHDRPAE